MTDFRFPAETEVSYPPHIIPGAPNRWQQGGAAAAADTAGGAFIDATGLRLNLFDDSGDETAGLLLSLLHTADLVRVTYGAGLVCTFLLDADATLPAGVVTLSGLLLVNGSAPLPPSGTYVTVQGVPAPFGAAPVSDDPDDEPDDDEIVLLECVTVQTGDTLWSYAQAWGTTVEAIAEWNGIDDVDHIEVGDTVCPPGIELEP